MGFKLSLLVAVEVNNVSTSMLTIHFTECQMRRFQVCCLNSTGVARGGKKWTAQLKCSFKSGTDSAIMKQWPAVIVYAQRTEHNRSSTFYQCFYSTYKREQNQIMYSECNLQIWVLNLLKTEYSTVLSSEETSPSFLTIELSKHFCHHPFMLKQPSHNVLSKTAESLVRHSRWQTKVTAASFSMNPHTVFITKNHIRFRSWVKDLRE